MYRIGLPFWRTLAKLGVPLKLRINVIRDKEANVLVATSNDLRGLVCEAATMDDLLKEVNFAVSDLLDLELNGKNNSLPTTDLRIYA